MAVLLLSTILVSISVFFVYIWFSRQKAYRKREEIGLKGPEPHWILGSIYHFLKRKKEIGFDDGYVWYIELHKKFGDRFGLFAGKDLIITLSNEEDIKEAFIKHFSNFSDRYVPCFIDKSCLSRSLFFSTYSNGWKQSRNAISPIFSSGSMKAMFGIVEAKIEILLDILEEKSESGERFNIHKDFEALTLDVIAKCAFGIDSDCQRDRLDEFLNQGKEFVDNIDYRKSWITAAGMILQELKFLWKLLYPFTGMAKAEIPLVEGLYERYQRRVAGEKTANVDLLKLMIDRNFRKENTDQMISEHDIVQNCFAVLLGGYDTSSTTLTYCSYLLARHPTVQQKLFEEIEGVREERGVCYDSILSMSYLDAVYKESLRMYPPVFQAIHRVCLKDIVIRDQFIPAGTAISVNPYTVHRSEENWENANEFIPERFLDWNDKNSLKWIPFGVGPRICVGMRFAEMEIKTAIVKLVEKFDLSMDPSEPELVPECDGVVMKPKDAVCVTLRRRRRKQ